MTTFLLLGGTICQIKFVNFVIHISYILTDLLIFCLFFLSYAKRDLLKSPTVISLYIFPLVLQFVKLYYLELS